jgi:hypothetical protein
MLRERNDFQQLMYETDPFPQCIALLIVLGKKAVSRIRDIMKKRVKYQIASLSVRIEP